MSIDEQCVWMLTQPQFELLDSFDPPRMVEANERAEVRSLVALQFLAMGIHEEADHAIRETAKLTLLGREVLNQEKFARYHKPSRLGRLARLFA